jgi:leucine dehydrogenase
LTKENAIVYVSDIHQDKMENMVAKYGATIFDGNDLYAADVDIYSPCALGATINDETIYKIKAKVIAGAANNQLAIESIHGEILRERGIAYAPDFLINAGGIINVYGEIAKYDKAEAMRRTENIYNTTLEIFNFADSNNITTQFAAMQIAQNRIDQRKKENTNK